MRETPPSNSHSSFADPAATATDAEWARVLNACAQGIPIGLGLLDSFLSGPDLARRIEFAVSTAKVDAAFRLELADTLQLDQSRNMTQAQIASLERAIDS
jgi:hypothetical protein